MTVPIRLSRLKNKAGEVGRGKGERGQRTDVGRYWGADLIKTCYIDVQNSQAIKQNKNKSGQ